MRFTVGAKLWFAFLGTLTFAVLAMYLLLHSSLKQSYLDQTSQQAVQRLEIFQQAIIDDCREHKGFQAPENDLARWMDIKSIIFSDSTRPVVNQRGDFSHEEVAQRFCFGV